MTKDEALRLALEALEYLATQIKPDYEHSKAITAIKAALEAKNEPVAWMYSPTGALFDICPNDADEGEFLPLYTTPPQRKPLTDEQIGDEFVRFQVGGMFTPFLYAIRAIEAALLEKQK